MPHQCVRCNTFYDDGNEAILKGCKCGGRLFFYIKKEKVKEAEQQVLPQLTAEDRQQIESDVLGLLDAQVNSEPVVLDFESIRVVKPGKYELDLVRLFKGEPVVFKLEDGKYIIDIPETFQRLRKK